MVQTGRVQFQALEPAKIVEEAQKAGCTSIAFTYNEPTVFFEYMIACARLAKEAGLFTVLVSNGYQSPQVMEELLPLLDAANIDLKSFRPDTYARYCKARLAPVLENLRILAHSAVHLEVTSLLIPGINDSTQEIRDMAFFVATELGRHIPWHISAFYPCRDMRHLPPTPGTTLEKAVEAAALENLDFVYAGNIPGLNQNTLCPACKAVLVERQGFQALADLAFMEANGACPHCHAPVYGKWNLVGNMQGCACC